MTCPECGYETDASKCEMCGACLLITLTDKGRAWLEAYDAANPEKAAEMDRRVRAVPKVKKLVNALGAEG